MKRIISGLIALMIVFSAIPAWATAAPTDNSKTVISPSDIKGHWAEASILAMINKGYASGYPDGTFKPNSPITRAEYIKMVVNVTGAPIEPVSAGEKWYAPYVNAAVSTGIHKTADFNANWDRAITRLEAARISVRAAVSSLRPQKASSEQLLYEAAKRGLISGLANGDLGTDKTSTRAEAVALTNRILTIQNGGTLKVDKRAASYAEVEYRHTNIETMWAGKMNPLPQTFDFSYSVKGTFEEILIIDLSDKNSPYRNWVNDSLIKIDRTSWNNDYLVAMKVTMQNIKTAPKTKLAIFNILGNPYFTRAAITSGTTPISAINYLNMESFNKVTTWHLMTISKSDLEQAKKRNQRLWYFDWSGVSRSIELSNNGVLFS